MVDVRQIQSGRGLVGLRPELRNHPKANYAIQKGDTLSKLANELGVELSDVLAANPQLKNADLLEVGQGIYLPEPSQTTTQQTEVPVGDSFGYYRSNQELLGSEEKDFRSDPTMQHVSEKLDTLSTVFSIAKNSYAASALAGADKAAVAAGGQASLAGRALGPVAIALATADTVVDQVLEGSTQTTAGTVVNAAGAGGTTIAIGTINPPLLLVDKGLEKLELPSITGTLDRSVDNIVTSGESFITGDETGLMEAHQKNLNSKNPVFREAAKAGQYYADNSMGDVLTGITDTISYYSGDSKNAFSKNVSKGGEWAGEKVDDFSEKAWGYIFDKAGF